ncbi:hypothetical protein [Hydrogenophaga sp. PAMC20947]|uniref:hypothetical protein n=1 Tax=Hydrogenophaga sp. PAMC20947 TaxID=2565558 RepID=UPI00109E051D|nr:hypothetical protein [Hydrogenophaga sp. PAMC20947]QCB47531.1 hypothetical protein E5678_16765 [Hydrogenophaga sp. PAMC20947]
MSTILNSFTRPSTHRAATSAQPAETPAGVGVRGLSVMLLAAAVSTLVIVAEQYGNALTDGDLFLGWVLMWAVVFGSLALFAGTARSLAGRAMRVLDGWSRARAQSRAEVRMWEIARTDPRIMAELNQARTRHESADTGFDEALAPMGLDAAPAQQEQPVGGAWAGFSERLAASRAGNIHLYYI